MIAGVVLGIGAPMFVGIAAAVKIDSPGPALFRQERVGRHGRHFQIHKFRTMAVSHSGVAVSSTGDPRVTRVGAVLRRTKLDELPQFFDVLVGAMSLVGPRPEVPQFVARWPDELRSEILSVRPGITDPTSIAFRREADELAEAEDPEEYYITTILPQKTNMYLEYVRHRSFVGDLRILQQTFAALCSDWQASDGEAEHFSQASEIPHER